MGKTIDLSDLVTFYHTLTISHNASVDAFVLRVNSVDLMHMGVPVASALNIISHLKQVA